jgi:hypothetical protein
MKKLVFLFAMIFTVSMANGQDNQATVNQTGTVENTLTGNINDAIIQQVSTTGGAIATVDQVASNGYNYVDVNQATNTGYTYNVNIDQTAGTNNEAYIFQATSGGPGLIDVDQTSNNDYNYANVRYSAGWIYDTNVQLDQLAGGSNSNGYNYADVNVYGASSYSRINVLQNATDGFNSTIIDAQHYSKVAGASYSSEAYIDNASPATQISATGNNELEIEMLSSEIGLYQNAGGNNFADIWARGSGSNNLAVYQDASGNNTLNALMNGNSAASVKQLNSSGNNIASINQ